MPPTAARPALARLAAILLLWFLSCAVIVPTAEAWVCAASNATAFDEFAMFGSALKGVLKVRGAAEPADPAPTDSSRRMPHVIHVGLQKAASTSVSDYLYAHGFCEPPHEVIQGGVEGLTKSGSSLFWKELQVLSRIAYVKEYLKGGVPEMASVSHEYASRFQTCAGNERRLDATPEYIQQRVVPAILYQAMTPSERRELRVVVVLRDPFARQLARFNELAESCVQGAEGGDWRPWRCKQVCAKAEGAPRLTRQELRRCGKTRAFRAFEDYAADTLLNKHMKTGLAAACRGVGIGKSMGRQKRDITIADGMRGDEASSPLAYLLGVQRWATVFGRKSVLVLDFAELVDVKGGGSARALGRLGGFLGLDEGSDKKWQRGEERQDDAASTTLSHSNGMAKAVSEVPCAAWERYGQEAVAQAGLLFEWMACTADEASEHERGLWGAGGPAQEALKAAWIGYDDRCGLEYSKDLRFPA